MIAEDRAIAVTIPGSAIGSTSANDTALRPKNRKRCTAKAASEPSSSASVVAPTAASIEPISAVRRSGSFQATENHLVVHRSGGHRCAMLLLNA